MDAAPNSDLAVLEWLAARGILKPDWALAATAKAGDTALMAWCAGKGASNFNWAMTEAAEGGQIEALAWCARKGATLFDRAMACAAGCGHLEAMRWCAAAGHFSRGHRAFTDALRWAVTNDSNEAAELCLSWGGDINAPGISKTAWVKAVRAGGIVVEPQDPPEVFALHDPLGGFRFYD